jgi:hypothetical protein
LSSWSAKIQRRRVYHQNAFMFLLILSNPVIATQNTDTLPNRAQTEQLSATLLCIVLDIIADNPNLIHGSAGSC